MPHRRTVQTGHSATRPGAWLPADPPPSPLPFGRRLPALQGAFATMTAVAALMVFHRPALAGPDGGSVAAGQVTISQTGPVTNINQFSNKAIINWQGFSIGAKETVNFNQPNAASATLNRVVGNEASVISGALNANGQVFIVNSAGILFNKNAQVNVGGLVASTLDISNANFMAGNYVFSGSSQASVINQGKINAAPGGYVALLGKTVSNEGVITATLGTVAMASGERITLNFEGNSLIDVTIDKGTLNALVENKRAIKSDGGRVILTARAADAVLSAQVNNTGVIQARTMAALKGGSGVEGTARTGSIKLYAYGGTTKVAGRLDASAPKGGPGGKIETSGSKVKIADTAVITTKAANGQNGTWTIDPDGFTIAAAGGDITGATLGSLLGNNNITLDSTSGNGADGNINVNAAVAWAADTTLTLNATNDININAPVTATGANAGLAMNYGGDYHINNITTNADGSLTIGPASVTLSGANASLHINGQSYILIHSIDQLAALSPPVLDANGDQVISDWDGRPVFTPATGYFALAQDLDASGRTFSGAVVNTLNGVMAGLGHKVSNLTINDTAGYGNDGLIGQLGSVQSNFPSPPTILGVGVARDIGVVNANITDSNMFGPGAGLDGALAGLVNINSSVSNSYAIGATLTGVFDIGGLVGGNQGSIDNGHAIMSISALNGGSDYGGLAGQNFGTISNSTAKGTITTAGVLQNDGSGLTYSTDVGGLVGFNAGSIINSHAYVDINATNSQEIGGLVGVNIAGFNFLGNFNPGNITGSSASGTLTANWTYTSVGGQDFGGLVGQNMGGFISNSSANVDVNVTANHTDDFGVATAANVGGLVGQNIIGFDPNTNTTFGGTISNSSSGGNVSADGVVDTIGGAVGLNFGGANSINGVHATGNVTGGAQSTGVGGLVGVNATGEVLNSSAGGNVTGGFRLGGLVGINGADGTIRNSIASGNVTGLFRSPFTGERSTGGLVGLNDGTIIDSAAIGSVTSVGENVGALVGSNNGTIVNSTYTDLPGARRATAQAAAAAAARAAAQVALSATNAANVISTNAQISATRPPSPTISKAGTQATAAIAGPKIEDNLEIEKSAPAAGQGSGAGASAKARHARTETEEESAPVEENHPRHRAASAESTKRKTFSGGKGAGFGAHIRSIDVDGQRYDLEDNSSRTGAPSQKAQ